MKLCIPVNSPNGLESLLEPHLPRAEHLLFFDTETRLCEEISLRETPPGAAEDIQIHAVLCGSINRVTLRTLIEQPDSWEVVTFDDPNTAPISYMRPVAAV